MPLTTQFDTPSSIRDLPNTSGFYKKWHKFIEGKIKKETPGPNGGAFYNPAKLDVRVIGKKTIGWMGFPRRVLLPNLRDKKEVAYRTADVLRTHGKHPQDEYFEWYVHKKSNKITKVTFTTELHDYYDQLWRFDRNAVVRLYREHVSPLVQESHLHTNGAYNIFNKWNTTDGIMHYTQDINTLRAAIELAQDMAMTPRNAANNYEANPKYGKTATSVDPRVDYDVHMLLRKSLHVSFDDPIGIYILGWDNSGITLPDGTPAPAGWWNIMRGKKGMALRLDYEVPDTYTFEVGDLKIGGHKIEYGGQLSEHITVGIVGTAGIKQ